ncbi:hypothetical protein N8482_00755 [Chitinophagales bacterium]|nr:hypothetical protein [Chitinophagales bacterium]
MRCIQNGGQTRHALSLRVLLWVMLFCSMGIVQGQEIDFRFSFEGEGLELDQNYYAADLGDSIQFSRIQFYLTPIAVSFEGELKQELAQSPHLLDWEFPKTCRFDLGEDLFVQADSIRFRIGIDSVLNVAGVMGGDLDPTKGMYWTWQSGYINVKMEGTSPACPARKNQFQYHLGGYAHPNENWQEIVLPIFAKDSIELSIDLAQFFHGLDFGNQNHVMSPSTEAVELARKFANLITVAN